MSLKHSKIVYFEIEFINIKLRVEVPYLHIHKHHDVYISLVATNYNRAV